MTDVALALAFQNKSRSSCYKYRQTKTDVKWVKCHTMSHCYKQYVILKTLNISMQRKVFIGITKLNLIKEFSFVNKLRYWLNAGLDMPGNC